MTRVVHCKKEPYDIYIGRPSKWGNPFSYKEETLAKFKVKNREESIQKYHEWIMNQPKLLESLHELKDKTLGCWCKPNEGFKGRLLCHGQILASLVDKVLPEQIE